MVDAIQDAPDPATPPMPGGGSSIPFTDTTDVLATLPGQKKDDANVSIGDMLTMTPEQLKKIEDSQVSLTKSQIGIEGAMAQDQARHDQMYSDRMRRLIAAEGATMDDIKPWNVDQEASKYSTSLWDKFGSPGFVISMVASAFTAMPMNSALNAGAAAINAINEGDYEAYHRHFDTWKENTNLTLKRIDLEEKQFNQIENLRKDDFNGWKARMESILAQFNDQRKLAMLQNGYFPELIEAIDAQTKAREQLSEAQLNIQRNDARLMIFRNFLGGSKDPQKIADAASFSDMVMSEPKTAEQIAVKNVVTAPGFYDLPSDERNKRIQEALKGIEQAKFGSRSMQSQLMQKAQEAADAARVADPSMTDEQYAQIFRDNLSANIKASQPVQAQKADADERHKKAMEDIAQGRLEELNRHNTAVEDFQNGKLTIMQARENEIEQHNQIMEGIANGKLGSQLTLTEEKLRHDKAMENLAKAKPKTQTQQKQDDYQSVRDDVTKEHPDWTPGKVSLETNRRIKQSATAVNLSDESADLIADQYLAGDRLAAVGFARSPAAMSQIRNAIERKAKALGMDGTQIAMKIAEFHGIQSAETAVGRRMATIEMFADETLRVLHVAEQASKEVPRGEFVPFNNALLAFEKNTGDPKVVALGAALNSLINTYAKAINGGQQGTVNDKEHAREIVEMAYSQRQMDSVFNILRAELDAAKAAPGDVKSGLRGLMTTTPTPPDDPNVIEYDASGNRITKH